MPAAKHPSSTTPSARATAPAPPAVAAAGFYQAASYEVSKSVGGQMVELMALMRREVDRRMARHDLTDAQWRPLWLIKCGLVGTAHELARVAQINAGAVTRMIDRLQSKGLVERQRSDSDRRVVHLRLTAAGERAVAHVPAVLASLNNDFLRGFSTDEWQTLLALIQRMVGNGRALQDSAAPAP